MGLVDSESILFNKMCELFETSLDQLVRGAEPTADLSQPTVVIQRENSRRDVRTIIGLILIVFGLLCFMLVFFLKGWGLDDALVYSVPFCSGSGGSGRGYYGRFGYLAKYAGIQ